MKLNSIQFLRAVAALLVVYVHAIDLQMRFATSHQQSFFYLQNFGAIGVDIFFAISGFIITFVANKYTGMGDGMDFLQKRFIRINPIYYISSFLFLIILLLTSWAGNRPILLVRIVSSVIDCLFIVPLSGQMDQYNPLLAIGWTLSFEWFFYLIFILLIMLKSNNKPLHLILLLAMLVLLGRVMLFNDYRLRFVSNPIILEFLLGVITCWIYLRLNVSNAIAYTLVLLGVAGFLYSIFWGYGAISEAGYTLSGALSMQRFLLWGIPSGALVAGCIFLEKNGKLERVWKNKLSRLIGDASYSIYLVHLSFFFVCTIAYTKFGFFLNPDLSIYLHVCAATLVGVAFYLFVEKPLLHYLQKVYTQKKSLSTGVLQA